MENENQFGQAQEAPMETEVQTEQPTEEVQEFEGQAEEAPIEEVQETEPEPEIDYESKISKMTDDYQSFKSKHDTMLNEHRGQVDELEWNLWVYQEYYNDNYQMLEALNKNPELLEQLKQQLPDQSFTKDDVNQMVESKVEEKIRAEQERVEFDSALNKWSDANANVPEQVLESVFTDIDKMNTEWKSNDDILKFMDMSLAYHTAWHQKAIWAKEEQLRQKKVQSASVWWWTEQSAGQQQVSNDFFKMPRTNPYIWL